MSDDKPVKPCTTCSGTRQAPQPSSTPRWRVMIFTSEAGGMHARKDHALAVVEVPIEDVRSGRIALYTDVSPAVPTEAQP